MHKNPSTHILYLLLLLFTGILATTMALAEDKRQNNNGWDNAITSLLAAGMYGIQQPESKGLTVKLQRSENMYKGLAADKARVNSQAITFSYEGSSGLLGFSAGYIYASAPSKNDTGTVFLGIDPMDNTAFDPTRSWYMAFDISQSYQFDNNIGFSLAGKSTLMRNPFDTEEGHVFSMLFNMPITYKNYITITPELQWSRPLGEIDPSTIAPLSENAAEEAADDVFFGGISISFSY